MYTNINIVDRNHTYNYIVEYEKSHTLNSSDFKTLECKSIGDKFFFVENGELILLDQGNYWEYSSKFVKELINVIPQNFKKSKISLYFPQFSLDTYNDNIIYILTVKLWLNDKEIILHSSHFNRINALACDKVKNFISQKYYEKIDFDIIDPYELIYSEDWKDWRKNICGQEYCSSSSIYFSLHPVMMNDGYFLKLNGSHGGQTSLPITKNNNDFLRLNINSNTNKSLIQKEPSIDCQIIFNQNYKNLQEYLRVNLGIKEFQIRYELIIGNKAMVYHQIESDFTKKELYSFQKTRFKNIEWTKFINNGSFIICSFNIIDENENDILYGISNKLIINEDLIKYFIYDDFEINNIKLNELDMNLYNINVVNKIDNQIIQLSNKEDSKNNLIQPTFFKVVDLSNITIYPNVTQTICINLDIYKSKVSSFILQLDGINFPEIGRTQYGVLFKIQGSKLSNNITSGQYYILDQNLELVTAGKYMSSK